MQVFGFTLNLLTLLADRALGRAGGGRRHRGRRERRASPARRASRPWRPRCSGARELVGPIIAMTITLAAVYAPIGLQGGLTGSLFREFAFTLAGAVFISGRRRADALADDVLAAARRREGGARVRGPDQSRDFDRFRRLLRAPARRHAGRASGRLHRLDRPQPAGDPDVPDVAEGAGADRGPGRHLRHHRRLGERDHRPDEPLHGGGQPGVFSSVPETQFSLPDHPPELRVRRHGAEAVGRAQAHRLRNPARRCRQKVREHPRHPDVAGPAAGAAGRRPVPGRVRHRLDRRAGAASWSSRGSSSRRPLQSGMFAFPPIIDVKIDQPQSEIVHRSRQGGRARA